MTPRSPRFITGFAGIPWGATAEAIQAARGEPAARESVFNGVEYAYRAPHGDRTVELEFTVHDRHGLIVGCQVVPLPPGTAGRAVIEEFRDEVGRAFPELPPVETQEVEAEGLDFDEAFARGEASWCIEWMDPTTTARIELLVWPAAEVFWLSYYGPHADAWEEERFHAERKE